MVFSGIPFLFYFLPAVLFLYLLTPAGGKNAVLLGASLFFCGFGDLKTLPLMGASVLQSYFLALLADRCRSRFCRTGCALLSAGISLGILIWFKYAGFFADTIRTVTGLPVPVIHTALPVGISFYTFQILSYTADVYRKKYPAERNLLRYACYVTMFPQLTAGPIVRYPDIAGELRHRVILPEYVYGGLRRFLAGLGKKILLADQLWELCAAFQQSEEKSLLFYWICAVTFALYAYFDFSGYSDMAVGLGRMLGFRLPENFRYPFLSESASEFWRRWHITLGGWFRDYVYIPLGGNRGGKVRWIRNIFVVWLLTGLWHGASWNFVLWGMLFAVLITVEKLSGGKFPGVLPAPFRRLYAFLFITVSFVIFSAPTLTEALGQIRCLFGAGGLPAVTPETVYYLRSYGATLIFAAIGCTPAVKFLYRKLRGGKKTGRFAAAAEPVLLAGLLILCTAYLVDGSFHPFLYFRF